MCPAGKPSYPYQATDLNKYQEEQRSGKWVLTEPPKKDTIWLLRELDKLWEAHSIISSSSSWSQIKSAIEISAHQPQ